MGDVGDRPVYLLHSLFPLRLRVDYDDSCTEYVYVMHYDK